MQIKDAQSSPPPRGGRVLEAANRIFLRVDQWIERMVPAHLNPMAQTGALANCTFLVAVISGIALLLWYKPSVYQAYSSLEAIRDMPWTGQWMRSLHRYSSDACIFFVLVHALRLLLAGRFTGARWLAWVTGVFLIVALWAVGWLGYWLVWDERAQLVAVSSAQMLDMVPIFSEPLSRTFLTNEGVNSLLFFTVFFFHMLVPLTMAVALWLHITRINRPNFITSKAMSLWVVGALLVVARVFPAYSEGPANLLQIPQDMTGDWWYLAPLMLTERLEAGALWALAFVGGTICLTLPWTLRRGTTKTAKVHLPSCNGCTLCAEDCPYNAIVMIPRTDGRKAPVQAVVNPDKCVGCGICVGACDSASITLDWIPAREKRKDIDEWIAETLSTDSAPYIAFLCANSAAASFPINPQTGQCEKLPGYRVLAVPCAGWVQPMLIERIIRKGAKAVLIVGCSHSDPPFREGGKWTEQRLQGERKPLFRSDKVDLSKVHFVRFDQTQPTALSEYAANLRKQIIPAPKIIKRIWPGAILTTIVLGLMTIAGSDLPLPLGSDMQPELILSFKVQGQITEQCRPLSYDEMAQQPRHMRREEECSRQRSPVRVRMSIDGELLLEKDYQPRGITNDGPSVGIERLVLSPGKYRVEIVISTGQDGGEEIYREAQTLEFHRGDRRVVVFEPSGDFEWF